MKILLANDNATYAHIGCLAVSDAHARLLGRAGHEVCERLFLGALDHHRGATDVELLNSLARDENLLAKVKSVDAVVVNGEGTIHHGAGRPLLALLALAQTQGKVTLLVNAVFEQTSGFDEALARLDDFTLRESRSLAHANVRSLRARLVPDSIVGAKFSDGAGYYLGDVATCCHPHRTDVRTALEIYRTRLGATFIPLELPQYMTNWRALRSKLSSARLMVTGRHHGVYLALLAGIPFVALASNTHKVEGTLEDLGRPDLLARDFEDIVRIRSSALSDRDSFRLMLTRLTKDQPLTTFQALGQGGPDREACEVARLADQVSRAEPWPIASDAGSNSAAS